MENYKEAFKALYDNAIEHIIDMFIVYDVKFIKIGHWDTLKIIYNDTDGEPKQLEVWQIRLADDYDIIFTDKYHDEIVCTSYNSIPYSEIANVVECMEDYFKNYFKK